MLRIHFTSEYGYIPEYKTEGSVGADLRAGKDYHFTPGSINLIDTGIRISIPEGYEGQIRARSGLAAEGFIVMNGVGCIDPDFRGIVKVIIGYFGKEEHIVLEKGERIAQLVISPVEKAIFFEKDELDTTKRGEGGFGSTGIN